MTSSVKGNEIPEYDEMEYTTTNAKLHMKLAQLQISNMKQGKTITVDMDKIPIVSDLFTKSKPAFYETTLSSDSQKGKLRIQEMNLALVVGAVTERELVEMYARYYILTAKGQRILEEIETKDRSGT